MRFSAKKVALVAAAVALIGSVTAVAAGRLAASESHSNLNDAVKNYEEVAALEGEVGFAFPALEEFSNGFKFTSAVPAENSDYDEEGNVLGSYLHGIFDSGAFWRALVNRVRAQKGLRQNEEALVTLSEYREREFDRLAAIVRQNLDMDAIYRILRGEDVPCGRWKQV